MMIRTKQNSGIVVAKSPGMIKSVTIDFAKETKKTTLEIWGSNSPYSSSADLYNHNKRGKLLGQAETGDGIRKTVTITIDEPYRYIGIKPKEMPIPIRSIEVVWEPSVELETIEHKVSTIGYSTLYYSNINLQVPSKVEAYTYKLDGENLAISKTYRENDVIPAGEAVVVKAPQGTYYFKKSNTPVVRDKDNVLRGTDALTSLSDNASAKFYMLSLDKNNDIRSVGFYWGNKTGSAFDNAAHKAYLVIPSNTARAKRFLFNNSTALQQVRKDEEKKTLYNLNGQRINGNYHGIVIRNGKKYLVKEQDAKD